MIISNFDGAIRNSTFVITFSNLLKEIDFASNFQTVFHLHLSAFKSRSKE